MPEAPPVESGSATVQQVDIVDTGPPPEPPAPKSEIHVTPATIDKGPQETVKKGSAMERLRDELRKKAKPAFYEENPDGPPAQPQTPPADAPTSATQPEGGEQTPERKTVTDSPPSSDPEHKGEKNPWKLVDRYKKESATHKARIAEMEKAMPEYTKMEALMKQMEDTNKRNDELEKEIRYHNYAKSKEYQDKYEKPYNAVWERAAREVEQITATDRNGEKRPGNVQDIVEISNLPLGEAQALAEERFGSLAGYIMNYRAKIHEMVEQRNAALQDAKNSSIERDKQFQSQVQQVNAVLQKSIKDTWDKANTEMVEDKSYGHLFREVDGDQDGNQRLAKGLELVNRAFSENPNDPRLTAEQRDAVVRRHAAVRMRAAAFGRLNARFVKLQGDYDKLKKQLDGYKESTPTTGSTNGSNVPPAPAHGIDRVFADLRKIAK